jgi:LuxR family maltose regulon positive regulatory protein
LLSEARLHLLAGNPQASAALIGQVGLSIQEEPQAYPEFSNFLLALQLLAEGKFEQAGQRVDWLLQLAEKTGALTSQLNCFAMKAVIAQALGNEVKALAFLERALALGEPEGFTQVFLIRGAPLQALLRKEVALHPSNTYANRLLAAFAAHDSKSEQGQLFAWPLPEPAEGRRPELVEGPRARPGRQAEPAQPAIPIEPLSERELEVLSLLDSSLTTPEIAERLYVSANTVRTHVKHIYARLGVHNRWEAVQQARALGLVGKSPT